MAQVVVILVIVIASIVAFFSIVWAWVIMAIPAVFLCLNAWGLSQTQYVTIPELSEHANAWFQKYAHVYTRPLASNDFSASCSTLALGSFVPSLICASRGFYWGLLISLVGYFTFSSLSRFYAPHRLLTSQSEACAHEEVSDYFKALMESDGHSSANSSNGGQSE